MFGLAPRLRTRAIVASALLVVVVVGLFAVLLGEYAHRRNALGAVARADARLRRSADLQKTMVDMETGVRGFQITHADRFLAPYRTAGAALPAELSLLERGTSGQGALVAGIARRAIAFRGYGAELIAAETAGRLSRSEELARTTEGKRQFDALRALFARYDAIGQAGLVRTQAQARASIGATRDTSVIVIIAVLVTLALYGFTLIRGVIVPLERAAATARRTELEDLNADLLTANQDLEQFAYVASHDLGEPLRTMAGFAELLQRRAAGRLTETDNEYVDHIVAGAGRMRELMDDLLAYARSGGGELVAEPVDTEQAVTKVVRGLDAAARVRLSALPTVSADPTLLAQVFQNLIANALKFDEDPHGTVEVSAQRLPDGWRFDVRDHGIGIAPDHAELVFKMFRRLNTHERFAGTGMGLAICQRIVERHGGRIWVAPAAGGGSVFSFTLPLDGDHSYRVTAATTT